MLSELAADNRRRIVANPIPGHELMHVLLNKLQAGDRRSIGRVEEVVDQVLEGFTKTGSPAIKNRGRKLLAQFKAQSPN